MSPSPTIIEATLADIDRIAPLFDAYRGFYEQASDIDGARVFLNDRLSRSESVVLFATIEGDQPVGFAQLYPTYSSVSMIQSWLLNDLFVAPAARGQGVGRALMQAVLDYAGQTDRQRVELDTAEDNVVAQGLYESMGFTRRDGFHHYDIPINE